MKQILFQNVSKAFPGLNKPALKPTNLIIEAGCLVTVLGTSGSGKTTLLKLINRLYEPDTGHILVDGQDTATIPKTELRRKIGYVIQHIGLFQHLSIAENIAIVPEILHWTPAQIRARTDELLHLVGLEPSQHRDRYPRQLSGGQQQRVGLARALAGDPGILLMDEPFGALDVLIRERLQDELLGIQQRLQKTIVFVTHDVQEALKLGQQVIVMDEGVIQQFDTPGNILNQPANQFVARLMGSDDPYRHLAITSAKQAMKPFMPQSRPEQRFVLQESQNLNDVLKTLLQAPPESVLIQNAEQEIVGEITWHDLKQQIHRPENFNEKSHFQGDE